MRPEAALEVVGQAGYGAINGAMAAPVLAKAARPFIAALLWVALGGYAAMAIVFAAVAALSVAFVAPLLALRRNA